MRRVAAALLAAGVLATAGCAAPLAPQHDRQGSAEPHGPARPSASSEPRATPSPSPSSSSSSSPSSASSTSTPQASARTPLGAGERVWAAFSHRGLSHAQWWAALEPLLSTSARATYVYDDPANLPDLTPTGALRMAVKAPYDPHSTAAVLVPTRQGTFHLDLERRSRTSPWLLFAIQFPRGVG